MKKDFYIFLLLLIMALAIIAITPLQILEFEPRYGLAPRTFPLLLMWFIVGLSAISLVKLKGAFKEEQQTMNGEEKQEDKEEIYDVRKIVPLFILTCLMVYLMKYLGFYISIFILIFGAMYIAGERNWGKNFLYILLMSVFIWGLFEKVMSISLPKGCLPFLF